MIELITDKQIRLKFQGVIVMDFTSIFMMTSSLKMLWNYHLASLYNILV